MRYILAILLLPLLLASFSASAVEITNFKSGLACTNTRSTSGDDGWICQSTQDVLVTDQGSCVYDGVTKPCTWFGYEFDYTRAPLHSKLQCSSAASTPTSYGNPKEILANNSSLLHFELELDGESGHFYNPMYFIFAVHNPDDSLIVETITCSIQGKVLFQAKYNFHFPVKPK